MCFLCVTCRRHNISLNRDLEDYSLNSLYTNLIKNNITKYITKPMNNSSKPFTKKACKACCQKTKISFENVFLTIFISFEGFLSSHLTISISLG